MTDFVFTPLVNSPHADVVSAALGGNTTDFGDIDVGQAVKLSTANNYVQVVAGDEIEGVVVAVDTITVNSGYSFGSVQKNMRMKAQVASDQAGNVTIGGLLVAGVPIALGTAGLYPQVKGGTPTSHLWRCIRILSGTGAAGDLILMERV